ESVEQVGIGIVQVIEDTLDLGFSLRIAGQQRVKNPLQVFPIDFANRMATATIVLDPRWQSGTRKVDHDIRIRIYDRRIKRHPEVLLDDATEGGEGLVDLDQHFVEPLSGHGRHRYNTAKMILEPFREVQGLVDQAVKIDRHWRNGNGHDILRRKTHSTS